MLGMFMGFQAQRNQNTRERLARNAGAVLYIDVRKATGSEIGVNSPLTNPWKDVSGYGNDVTLVNCAGTTADGYLMKLLPNGNTMPMFKPDGTDTYGTMVNTSSMDITGTEDFAICGCFLTGASLQTSTIIHKGLGAEIATSQYGVILIGIDGSFSLRIAGVDFPCGITILPNTLYEFRLTRIAGFSKAKINGVSGTTVANTASLVSKPNLSLFARSDGTTGTIFSKDFHAYLAVFRGTKCTEANVNKFCELAKKGYV